MTPDCVLDFMKAHNMPLTTANYLAIAYMGDVPDEIGGEILASIPKEIGEAEDVRWMAEIGVRWEPDSDDPED
jgi:hypothetical protein